MKRGTSINIFKGSLFYKDYLSLLILNVAITVWLELIVKNFIY